MSAIDEILSQIPMSQLAAQLGVDEKTAEGATRQALPALLGGMEANAADPDGAASLSRAIGKHDGSLVEGGVDLGQVNTGDGEKIVSHVFGSNKDQVVSQLGGLGDLLGGVLGGKSGGSQGGLGGGLGDLLGGLLGGGRR